MKTALLHYWLTNMRGGEKVFREICRMFPEGDIFTHAYRPDRVPCLSSRVVHESFIARLPLGRKMPQAYLPLMPLASRELKLDGYDLIVSSESGPIKGIVRPKDARHVCYCHTPMRYIWDMYDDYYRMAGFGDRIAMRAFRDYLRKEDLKSADSVDVFVANSKFVADRIRRIYGREAAVVYPFVDFDFFSAANLQPSTFNLQPDYYLLAGQLISYKRPDLAILACLKMNRRLKVIGVGNQIEKLKKLTAGNPNIEFLGRVSNDDLRAAYTNAKALLFPGVEDFGIVPLEAQAAGTPVIAFDRGGARETVVSGSTGLFFGEPSVESLCAVIEEFEARAWDSGACRANAARFRPETFRERFGAIVRGVVENGVPLPALAANPPTLRIVVTTHKPYRMPEGEAYFPLQAGSAIHPALGYARDDAGENISAKNPGYCELTGLYWAWKNLASDYIGIVHYRRLFKASPQEIASALRSCEAVLPRRRNYFIETNYSQYAHAHHAADLELTREIVAERHPRYLAEYDACMRRTSGHKFNMLVMRREMLDRYCAWLFDILFELERRLDISSYSDYDKRVFGFVAERMIDVWLEHNGISYVEFPVRNLESQHWPRKIARFLKRKLDGGLRRRQ